MVIDAFHKTQATAQGRGKRQARDPIESQSRATLHHRSGVSDTHLRELYAVPGAAFSGEEDFGITPLEAQTSGRPVMTYGAGGA